MNTISESRKEAQNAQKVPWNSDGRNAVAPESTQLALPIEGQELPYAQEFEVWKQQPGARQVLAHIYRMAARYGERFVRSGRRVSVRLLWELTRDHIGVARARMRKKGVDLKQWKGFRLNNNFHAHVARHITSRRPEWKGMFELRELDKPRRLKRRVTVEEFEEGSRKGAKAQRV